MLGGLVSATKDRDVEGGCFTRGESQNDGAVVLSEADNVFAQPTQASRLGLRETIFDQAREVPTVDQAGNKAKAILARVSTRSQPSPEMIGVIGKSAHVRGSDVQSMALVFSRIGEPAANLRARFDQSQMNVVVGAFQQMRSDERAACASTDDGDRTGAGPFR